MSSYNVRFGFGMVYTAQIPVKVMEYVKAKGEGAVAGVELTPAFRTVPNLVVADIREAGVETPMHWADTNEVVPIIHGVAFYLTPQFTNGMAASFAMKGVNLRTGHEEVDGLTDKPCQSYWASSPPWIDGYVPSHQQGVRQFLPLSGEEEMAADVAHFVGVTPDNPWLDAISAAFYLPRDLRKLAESQHYRGGYETLGLESFSLGATKGMTTRGAMRSAMPEAVGMGAGAVMKQRHPDDPTVESDDFIQTPFIRVTTRMVWVDWWNQAAAAIGESQLTVKDQRDLREQQEQYERRLWRQLNFTVDTNVDGFPTPK